MSSLSAMSRRALVGAQIDKLAEYDESLSDIAAEATSLRDELGRLRAEAARLTDLLAERDDAVSRLDREHADASREAQAAALSLRKTQARLEVSREQVSTLLRQQHALLARLDEAERLLTLATQTGSRLRDSLVERERTIEGLRAEARTRGHSQHAPRPAAEGRPQAAALSASAVFRPATAAPNPTPPASGRDA